MKTRVASCLAVMMIAGCDTLFSWAPPNTPPAPTCDYTPFAPPAEFTQTPDAPVCVIGSTPPPLPCNCEDYDSLYGGKIPPGVFDPGFSNSPTPGATFPGIPGPGEPDAGFQAAAGCNPWIQFASPWCSLLAELSGRVVNTSGPNFQGDGDMTANVCPPQATMFTVDRDARIHQQELRTYQSFGIGPDTEGAAFPYGRVHLEWQPCRQYKGGYTVPVRDDQGTIVRQETYASVLPAPGDQMSASGDWVVDTFCDEPQTLYQGHDCRYSEIHEARALAVVRPDPGDANRNFGFVTTFLADQPRQDTGIFLDMVVPPSADPTRTKLECRWEDGAQASADCGFQQPNHRHSAFRAAPTAQLVGGQLACVVQLRCDSAQCTYNQVNWRCCDGTAVECFQDSCDGKDWATLYASDPDGACDKVLYSGVMAAEWRDPADVWVCNNCACNDPSKPGATIAAPVQGCVPSGLDPTNPDDQRAACEAICPGRTTCGVAPGCEIGACEAPAPGVAIAERVMEHACDPDRPIGSPSSPSGDYLVQLDTSSSMTAHDGQDDITKQLAGFVYVNAADGILDVASVRATVDDFTTHGHHVTDIVLANSERVVAQLDGDQFQVPQGLGVFVLRARVDGELKGAEFQNPERIDGSFNPATGEFYALVHAVRPSSDGKVSLDATLRGHVINRPPVADASKTPETVECESHQGSVVTLDATASHDPDAGDVISHVQWFRPTGDGLGNQPQQSVTFALGANGYRLHVYDRKLGSDFTDGAVEVVDTTPPQLRVEPRNLCLWAPNHRRIRLRIGEDIHAQASDVCDPDPTVKVVSVVSDEPDNALGSGNTSQDVSFSDSAICVRRERSGRGSGRTYIATIRATDESGNATERVVRIFVPHDQRSALPGCRSTGDVIGDDAPCE